MIRRRPFAAAAWSGLQKTLSTFQRRPRPNFTFFVGFIGLGHGIRAGNSGKTAQPGVANRPDVLKESQADTSLCIVGLLIRSRGRTTKELLSSTQSAEPLVEPLLPVRGPNKTT